MHEDKATRGLRAKLAKKLKAEGHIRTPAVEKAFLAVPRHLFVPPGVSPAEAYRDEVVPLLPGLAALSQPSIVALMLEELAVDTGMKVLEIGTASGYNAGLLACLTGEQALVHTIEIEERLAEQARRNLEAAGFGGVQVRAGDGTLGWPEAAPFARIIVTAEAADLSWTLLRQLAAGGLLLAPFAVPGLPALLLRLRAGERQVLGEFIAAPVAFVPLRGEYGVGEGGRETAVRRAREALWLAEERASAEGGLSFSQRLALYLITAAVAEATALAPGETAEEGWRRFASAGQPDLEELGVSARPAKRDLPTDLAFRRRDCDFLLELPLERNPNKGGESPRREVVR
ncbi:MAG TPA: protein-L-isoaspartate O-methyltransferase [Firmicutes bacterium]|nr:protein-L-isoaspartate O-methyltransferase [Bacillota bacterium]